MWTIKTLKLFHRDGTFIYIKENNKISVVSYILEKERKKKQMQMARIAILFDKYDTDDRS